MIRIADSTGRALEAIRCQPCENDRDGAWCRVITVRGEKVSYSDLSWPLARRIVPKLLARYGHSSVPGLFAGSAILV